MGGWLSFGKSKEAEVVEESGTWGVIRGEVEELMQG